MTAPVRRVALAGNPNVGKSTIFNALAKLHQHTGNWPGKTVETARGRCSFRGMDYELIDLPGCYSLFARSAEEEVARDFLCRGAPDAAIVVCDATCLERNLNLVLQVMEVVPRTVVAVNLMDEAEKKGVRVDLGQLSRSLGVPVVGTTARDEKGLSALLSALEGTFAAPSRPLSDPLPDFSADDGQAETFVRRAETISRAAVTVPEDAARRDRLLDRLFTSRLTGFPIMLLLLLGVFWLTIVGANAPSAWLSAAFGTLGEALTAALLSLSLPPALVDALMNGVYKVMTWVIAVMLPPMAIFFPLFTLLEDFGYLPRVAFNLDRCFHACRACGKQALTTMMGFGCNAAAVTGCRIIDSPRERLIAILTNAFVPCNGRFPTLITLITLFLAGSGVRGAALLTAAIVLGVGMTLLASRLLSATVLKGIPSSFTLELPPYRTPQVGKVIVRSVLDRTLKVLGRAVVSAAPAGLILWLLSHITLGEVSLLARFTALLDPLGRILGLDGVILAGFLLALPANEIALPIMLMAYTGGGELLELEGAALLQTLSAQGWTASTAVCVGLFTLMHWPCATTLLTVRKETGSWRWTALAFALPTAFGLLACLLANLLLP